MDAWTDGTVHVLASEEGDTLRVFREDRVALERKVGLPWKCPLAVDVEAGLVHAGRPLVSFRIDTLEPVATHEDDITRVVCLGDCRVAATRNVQGKAPELVIGKLGAGWDERHELVFPGGRRCPGALTSDEPPARRMGRDIRLSANEHGIVVADGQAGVVARLGAGAAAFDQVLHFGACDETELFAEAIAGGLLVVARWAARESRVLKVMRDAPVVTLLEGSGCFAHALDGDRYLAYDGRHAVAGDLNGGPLAQVRCKGFLRASAARGRTAVLAGDDVLHVLRLNGAELTHAPIVLTARFDVSAYFEKKLRGRAEDALMKGFGSMISGGSPEPGKGHRYTLCKVDGASVEKARTRLAESGGAHIEVTPAGA